MATPAQTPNPAGGQPQQGQAQGGGATNPLQIVAAITRLAQMLAQAAPPCQPEAQATMEQMQKCAQKITGAQQGQSSGPAPY